MDHISPPFFDRRPGPDYKLAPRLVAWVVVGTGVAELLADLSHMMISLDDTAMGYGLWIQLCGYVSDHVFWFKKNKYYI